MKFLKHPLRTREARKVMRKEHRHIIVQLERDFISLYLLMLCPIFAGLFNFANYMTSATSLEGLPLRSKIK
jgi:hypothetical protein